LSSFQDRTNNRESKNCLFLVVQHTKEIQVSSIVSVQPFAILPCPTNRSVPRINIQIGLNSTNRYELSVHGSLFIFHGQQVRDVNHPSPCLVCLMTWPTCQACPKERRKGVFKAVTYMRDEEEGDGEENCHVIKRQRGGEGI